MKKRIVFFPVLVCLIWSASCPGQNRQIRFDARPWQQLLAQAKQEKKMIYLDCYTSWCGWCRWAEEHVFINDTVADFFNQHFICAKLDMEKGEGLEMAKKYSIKAFPYSLYFSPEGELLHRVAGASPPAYFVAQGNKALLPQSQFATLEKAFREKPKDASAALAYFAAMDAAAMRPQRQAEKFLFTQKDSALLSEANWKILNDYAGYASGAFKYFEQHTALFKARIGTAAVEKKLDDVYFEEMNKVYKRGDLAFYTKLKSQYQKLKTKECERKIDLVERRLRKMPYADMKNAIEIRDSIVGPVNVSRGKGQVIEHQVESNTIWFKLNIDHDTLLTFDLVPQDSLDDYDFLVFKCTSDTCAREIKYNLALRPRMCRSYCTSKSGITGLSNYSREPVIGEGPGPAFASALPVKAGETYYLMVDFPEIYIQGNRKPLGFSIYFYNYWPRRRSPVVLQTIHFKSNAAVLQNEAFAELDRLAAQLKKNHMVIEVSGHTDNQGDADKNQKLSAARAEAVVNYLVSKNIDAKRLFSKGYGSSRPVGLNNTEEGRKKNRRVEFLVLLN